MTDKVCVVDGCDRPRAGRHRFCATHEHRVRRYGDPHFTRYTPRGRRLEVFAELIALDTDECTLWPFRPSGSGYPTLSIGGRTIGAHVLACEHAHGPRPFPKADAAHYCGVCLCVNPRHLRWATRAENLADQLIHGTRRRRSADTTTRRTDAQ